jgi:hypothetical protein
MSRTDQRGVMRSCDGALVAFYVLCEIQAPARQPIVGFSGGGGGQAPRWEGRGRGGGWRREPLLGSLDGLVLHWKTESRQTADDLSHLARDFRSRAHVVGTLMANLCRDPFPCAGRPAAMASSRGGRGRGSRNMSLVVNNPPPMQVRVMNCVCVV